MSNEQYEGVLTRLFSTGSSAKILDFFLDHKEYDYSSMEISENTGLSFRTIIKELPKLEKLGLVILHRKVGRTALYTLNDKNEPVAMLEKFSLLVSQKDSLYEPQRLQQEILEPDAELESPHFAASKSRD
jgi:DNA-binding transcriptional ArsR family regulator